MDHDRAARAGADQHGDAERLDAGGVGQVGEGLEVVLDLAQELRVVGHVEAAEGADHERDVVSAASLELAEEGVDVVVAGLAVHALEGSTDS